MHGIRDRPSLDRNHQSSVLVSTSSVTSRMHRRCRCASSGAHRRRTRGHHAGLRSRGRSRCPHRGRRSGRHQRGHEARELGVGHAVAERETPFATIAISRRQDDLYRARGDGCQRLPPPRRRTEGDTRRPLESGARGHKHHGSSACRGDVVLPGPLTVSTWFSWRMAVLVRCARSASFLPGQAWRGQSPGGSGRRPLRSPCLDAPEAHAGQAVLVIGGGDTAVETAMLPLQCRSTRHPQLPRLILRSPKRIESYPGSRPSSVMGNSAFSERRWWTPSNRMQ